MEQTTVIVNTDKCVSFSVNFINYVKFSDELTGNEFVVGSNVNSTFIAEVYNSVKETRVYTLMTNGTEKYFNKKYPKCTHFKTPKLRVRKKVIKDHPEFFV